MQFLFNSTNIYKSYSPVGDLIVIATGLVFLILMKVSYIAKSKTYRIFQMLLFELLTSSVIRLLFYGSLYKYSCGQNIPIRFILLLHALSQISIYLMLFTFMFYMQEPLHIDPKISKGHMTLVFVVASIFSIFSFSEIFTNVGLVITRDDNGKMLIISTFDMFPFGYLLLLFFVGFTAFYYRKRVFGQVFVGIAITTAMSLILMIIQFMFDYDTFTVVSFLFPLYTLFYMIHSSPYDVDAGMLNEKEFKKFVLDSKKPLLLVEIYIRAINKSNVEYPVNFKKNIRASFSRYFSDILMFQITSGHIVFTTTKFQKKDYCKKAKHFFGEVYTECLQHSLDFKGITIMTEEAHLNKKNCLKLMRYAGSKINENEWHFVNEKDIQDYNEYTEIIKALEDINNKKDIEDERICVYCQPVWNINKQQYDTGESLMRLSLNNKLIPPIQFIPIAEKMNLIYQMSLTILNKTCKAVSYFLENGYEVQRISVNFAVADFKVDSFCSDVLRTISMNHIPYDKIAIEMTETQNESDFLIIQKKMNYLKEFGIKFYLDDFGTGYSNYERIFELPFDIIKFDRSLVLACSNNEKSGKMVENIANMFYETQYAVLYEGVETDKDVAICEQMHALYLQGFHYSKPLPIEEMTQFFQRK